MKKENNEAKTSSESDVIESSEKIEKEIRPRRRKIIRNRQLLFSVCIVCAVFAGWFVWRVFFNPLIDGTWHMKYNGVYTETYDIAEESGGIDVSATDDIAEREVKFSEDLTYEFLKDGVCRVTLGSMTVEGTYEAGTTKDYGNVLSANVVYEYSPIFYGVYKYTASGNIFTGRHLTLEEIASEFEEENLDVVPENVTLDRGKGELGMEPIKDAKIDERLIGKWHDDTNDVTFEFTEDGHMIRTTSDGVSMDHLYSVVSDNAIFAKYVVDTEESYDIGYEYKNGTLYINEVEMRKI